jgi:hypothetical protein
MYELVAYGIQLPSDSAAAAACAHTTVAATRGAYSPSSPYSTSRYRYRTVLQLYL